MASIPLSTVCEIANAAAVDVAVELGRPWRLEKLRTEALNACRTATRRAASAGLSGEQASPLVRGCAYEQALKAGRELDALPPDQQQPTSEQIDAVLGVFSIEQWITLLVSLDQASTETLLAHLRQHASELKQRFGRRKVERVEGRAIMRDTELWLAENRSKLVPVSDVYWADFWREQARQANREGRGRPASGRPVAEQGSDRAIARRLSKRDEQTGREMKVDGREVKRWRERTEELPYEQYAAGKTDEEVESGAGLIAYWTMIRKKHQRKN
jgi:hypothetical protein